MSLPSVCVRHESWPLARPFVIARGAITEVEVVVVEITRAGCTGRGESCPVPHYGESTAGVLAQVTGIAARISAGESWNELHDIMPAGAARNAVDCAIWDLQAKELLLPVWHLAGLPQPKPVDGLYTIGIGAPGAMAEAARQAAVQNPILKVKLGAAGDRERIRAVRDAVPDRKSVV